MPSATRRKAALWVGRSAHWRHSRFSRRRYWDRSLLPALLLQHSVEPLSAVLSADSLAGPGRWVASEFQKKRGKETGGRMGPGRFWCECGPRDLRKPVGTI